MDSVLYPYLFPIILLFLSFLLFFSVSPFDWFLLFSFSFLLALLRVLLALYQKTIPKFYMLKVWMLFSLVISLFELVTLDIAECLFRFWVLMMLIYSSEMLFGSSVDCIHSPTSLVNREDMKSCP